MGLALNCCSKNNSTLLCDEVCAPCLAMFVAVAFCIEIWRTMVLMMLLLATCIGSHWRCQDARRQLNNSFHDCASSLFPQLAHPILSLHLNYLIPERTDKTMNYHPKTLELSGKWVSSVQAATANTFHWRESKQEATGIPNPAKELLYREV